MVHSVAFFGKKFEEFDGTEYVYKESNSVLLTDFTERLKVIFLQKLLLLK